MFDGPSERIGNLTKLATVFDLYEDERWTSGRGRMVRTGFIKLAGRCSGFLLALILTCAGDGRTRTETTPSPTPAELEAPPQPGPRAPPAATQDASVIAAPQIADEAMQLHQRLLALPARLASGSKLDEFEHTTYELRGVIGERSRSTEAAIQSGAVLAELQQSLLDWQSLDEQVNDLADKLTEQATAVEAVASSLRNDKTVWERTFEQARAEQSPPELVELTAKAVADIEEALHLAERRQARIAALQQSVAAQGAVVSGEIESLRRARTQSQRSLLERDSPPLWEVQFSTRADESLARLLRRSYADDAARLGNFVRAKGDVLWGVTLLTLFALAFFAGLGRRARADGSAEAREVFRRPVSLALLVGLAAIIPLFPDAPNSFRRLTDLAAVVPVVRILMPRLTPPFRKMLVALLASVLAWQLIKFLEVPVWLKRDLLALCCVAVTILFGWLAFAARRGDVRLQRNPGAALAGVSLGLTLIVTSLLANVLGNFGLSDILALGTFVSAYRAVTLYTIFVAGSLIIDHALHAQAAHRFATIQAGADRLARRLSLALGLLLLLLWLHTTLELFAVRGAVYGAVTAALNFSISLGTATFAFSSLFAFAVTLFVGYLIARVIRVILGEELLPRLNLARGLPNAIATVTHYAILVLVFILALVAAGVELSKFTLLTGAVGVGVGFGLQGVVNNFVSGLVLHFERPVRVGDVLEVRGVSGEVTKIGFRSSTLQCLDGSVLIVPNADLVSQQVINWTLTGTRRQILLNVHVAYGNDPTRVRDLLRKTAAAHPEVLESPEPTALFLGFGDFALNFEVRFWAPLPEVVSELKSDVALGIAAALSGAGIEVPVPRRDLHIKGLDQVREAVAPPRRTGDEIAPDGRPLESPGAPRS